MLLTGGDGGGGLSVMQQSIMKPNSDGQQACSLGKLYGASRHSGFAPHSLNCPDPGGDGDGGFGGGGGGGFGIFG
tara:strand:- start:14001 stop:14225 length:225 start_codon:yes stop_codon:yes gene_type:complete